MVERRPHLRCHKGMEHWHVHGRVDSNRLGHGQQRRRPRHRLQGDAQIVRFPTEPAPATDRKEKVEARRLSR